MPLHVMKIVREEFEKARVEMVGSKNIQPVWNAADLAVLRSCILERIEKECIEQVDPIEREARAIVGGTFLLSEGPGEYFSSEEAAQAYLDGETGITSRHAENARPYDDPDLTKIVEELIPDGLFDVPVSFDYPCQECGKGTVRLRFGPCTTKFEGNSFTVEQARIGECDRCAAKHFSAVETKRWRQMYRAAVTKIIGS